MTKKMKVYPPLISPEELMALKKDNYLILIDARFGQDKYEENHLKGALYVELNSQMSHVGENAADGGRHPLPEIQAFAKVLGKLGIDRESHVVVYDDKSGAMSAARFWWMLKALGHKKIQVLDGGMDAAIKAGYPMSSTIENMEEKDPYPAEAWSLPLATMDEVEKAAKNKEQLVVDVREAERYVGKMEPIDLVAGHIPGAVNIPFAGNLDKKGFFLSPESLKKKYQQALGNTPPGQAIVHCGSGVTACHTLLALAHAGMEIPQLYVGSWSEWSRNEKPIARE
ncbi:MAG: sulfurtransferase [Cyclobacteriaceae bacterium]